LSGSPSGNRWSVALAAPQDEVRGSSAAARAEWILVGLFELVVFLGSY
jgi:hypothetical protein